MGRWSVSLDFESKNDGDGQDCNAFIYICWGGMLLWSIFLNLSYANHFISFELIDTSHVILSNYVPNVQYRDRIKCRRNSRLCRSSVASRSLWDRPRIDSDRTRVVRSPQHYPRSLTSPHLRFRIVASRSLPSRHRFKIAHIAHQNFSPIYVGLHKSEIGNC